MRLYMTGIKNICDAENAVSLGASAIGIKMGYGMDDVHPETARDIFFNLPVFISRVGIFVNEKRYHIQELVTFCRLDTLHFLGQEQPEDLERYPEHIIKTFKQKDIARLKDYDLHGIVLKLNSGIVTGVDVKNMKKPSLILSGDLTLSEWTQAIKNYQPYGIQWDLTVNDPKILPGLLREIFR